MNEVEQATTNRVVGHVLEVRQSDRGAAARIRAGLAPQTEQRAYADILPLLSPTTTQFQEQTYLRAAALIASHPHINQLSETRLPIGASFRRFSFALAQRRNAEDPYGVSPGSPDGIASRLGQLPEQNLDSATLTFSRILHLGDQLEVPVDYFDLTRTLLRWGYGTTEESSTVRRRPLHDYYRYSVTPPKKESK